MEELTFRTPVVVGRLRELESQQLRPDPENDVLHVTTQLRHEINLNPAPRSAVPNVTMRYLDLEHLFETQRLRAQLEVCGNSVPDARLVFDRTDRGAVDFDRIGSAGQSQQPRTREGLPEAPAALAHGDAGRYRPGDAHELLGRYERCRSRRRRNG